MVKCMLWLDHQAVVRPVYCALLPAYVIQNMDLLSVQIPFGSIAIPSEARS
jgi:hypothetical protein